MSDVTRVVYDGHDFVEPVSNNTPPPAGPAPTPAPQINAEPGIIRTHRNADGSTEVSHSGPVRMNANELFSRTDATGILATAVNDFGRPVSGNELTPKTIVKAAGMTMPLHAAEHAGLVTRNPDGSYRETTEAERATPTKHEDVSDTVDFTNPTEAAAVSAFSQNVPLSVQQQLIASTIAGKEIPLALIEDGARALNVTPEAFVQNVAQVFSAFQSQAVTAVKSLGLTDSDMSEFDAWAEANHREAFADAARELMLAGSTRGMKELANQYMRAMPPSVEALQAAGYRVGRSGDGRHVTVFIDGQEISIEAAAKQGLI